MKNRHDKSELYIWWKGLGDKFARLSSFLSPSLICILLSMFLTSVSSGQLLVEILTIYDL